jgi:hypothetical protein
MILQLSQKFGEIFDDIGIKVLFLVVKFWDLVIEKDFQHLQNIFLKKKPKICHISKEK